MGLKFSIGFILVLVLPYIVQLRYGDDFETYPAVILPSGAGIVIKDSLEYNFDYTLIYGVDSRNKWLEISPEHFLYPVRSNYFYHIVERIHWIDNPPKNDVIQGVLGSYMFDKGFIRGRYREQDIPEFKLWLKTKLIQSGLSGDSLKIEQHSVRIDNKIKKKFDEVRSFEIITL